MALQQTGQIDLMALSLDKKTLYLMLYDTIPLDNEKEHAYLLQEKLSAYCEFIKERRFKETYPEYEGFSNFVIRITFESAPGVLIEKIMENILQRIEPQTIGIEYMVAEKK